MKTPYHHIYFDLDHTLWDFYTNCKITLEELYSQYNFHSLGFTKEAFFDHYIEINNAMWADYHKGKITKEIIRGKRFEYTFRQLGVSKSMLPDSIDEAFLALCPAKGHVFPYTFEVLNYLKAKKYSLHIITNGFKETQQIKLSTSGLAPYFDHVIESDVCGFMKPDIKIFELALSLSNAKAHESMMIGDDLLADVLGAKNAGIDQVFINRHFVKHQETLTHEIECLSELKNIL